MNLGITKGQAVRYALLPQVFPRFRTLISAGFSNLAYFIALVYQATNLLPANHAYLKSENFGKYTIRNVFYEASRNLVFSFKHIDQIIIFFALITGMFLLAIQFFFLIIAIFINPAAAQGTVNLNLIDEFFVTPNPERDLALRMLDSVFGVPEIFGSDEPVLTQFHEALHALFQIYSFGLLVVAVIILIYFIFAILAETAQTGTPFGKRYNHVWAPIRLVVGVGMLVPMTYGLNAGQWITLNAAKFGSGFATQGWILFNETLADNYLDPDTLIAEPQVQELKDLIAFISIAKACQRGFAVATADKIIIEAYVINDNDGGTSELLETLTYLRAVNIIAKGKDVRIRFGEKKPFHTSSTANIYPYCGDLVLQNTEESVEVVPSGDGGEIFTSPGQAINEAFFNHIKSLWVSADRLKITSASYNFIDRRMKNGDVPDPGEGFRNALLDDARIAIESGVRSAVAAAKQTEFDPDQTYMIYGWGSAALWYNQIANANGQITTAALNKPQIKNWPKPMMYTCEENQQQNAETSHTDCFNPNLSKGKQVQYLSKLDENLAKGLGEYHKFWFKNSESLTGNVFMDVVNAILGTQGLFDMCANADIHPLAQLSSLGKGMVEAAIRNLAISAGTGAASILDTFIGPALGAASSFFGTVASIGILIGFILYYIVPFLPFLYFFFAMGGWIKGIFEAMVGVPLWALAHLRIDGEGLPGDAGINGYFLVFEIFIRPILILFGFVASILIFSAMVTVLNDIFTIVVSNLSGFDPDAGDGICSSEDSRAIQNPGTIEWVRGPIDELFFTVVYAIMVYMIGMASFKLIDLIPNNILRWMGQGVQTFNDQAGAPAEGLISKVAIGGSMLSSQMNMAGQMKDAASNLKTGISQVLNGK